MRIQGLAFVWALAIIGVFSCVTLLYFGNNLCLRSKISFAGKQAALFGLNCHYFNGVSRNADPKAVEAATQAAIRPVLDDAGLATASLNFQTGTGPLLGRAVVNVPGLQMLAGGAPALGVVFPKSLTVSQEVKVPAADCSFPYVVTVAFTGGSKPTYIVVPAAAAGPWQATGNPPNPWPQYLASCSLGEYEPGYIFFTNDQECTNCTLFHAPSW